MPGYDFHRFVNINRSQIEDLLCCICMDVVKEPIRSAVCKHLYCYDCIHNWLKTSETCPYDRSPLTDSELQNTPQTQQIIDDFIIRCEYHQSGCEYVCAVKEMNTHLANCLHNPDRVCSKCEQTLGNEETHNCVKMLLAANKSLISEMDLVKSERNKLLEEIKCQRQRTFDVS